MVLAERGKRGGGGGEKGETPGMELVILIKDSTFYLLVYLVVSTEIHR